MGPLTLFWDLKPKLKITHLLVFAGGDVLEEARYGHAWRALETHISEEGQHVTALAVVDADAVAEQHDIIKETEDLRRGL